MKSIILHVVPDVEYNDKLLCGKVPTAVQHRAYLTLILTGDSTWTAYVPGKYKRCKKCAKKLAKDYPEVTLLDLRNAML
jgi:hypothetical protein